MAYTLNKRRGQKLSGRGHSKHKSGSKGGTGFAGHRSHKIRERQKFVKKSRYIKYNYIIKHFNYYLKKQWIIKVDDIYHILSDKFGRYKIIEVPRLADDSEIKIYGKNFAKPK